MSNLGSRIDRFFEYRYYIFSTAGLFKKDIHERYFQNDG